MLLFPRRAPYFTLFSPLDLWACFSDSSSAPNNTFNLAAFGYKRATRPDSTRNKSYSNAIKVFKLPWTCVFPPPKSLQTSCICMASGLCGNRGSKGKKEMQTHIHNETYGLPLSFFFFPRKDRRYHLSESQAKVKQTAIMMWRQKEIPTADFF